jgi:uncharacterized protein YuzB (UPF0349 family)
MAAAIYPLLFFLGEKHRVYKIMYCFRNQVEENKQRLLELGNQIDTEMEFIPIYCMRLCFLCQQQFVCSVDGALIVAKSLEELIEHVKGKQSGAQ